MKWTKLLCVLSGFCSLLALCSSLEAQTTTKTSASYSIAIASSPQPIQLNSAIIVTITVTNTSKSDIYWRAESHNTAFRAFRFSLTQDSHETETTAFHRMITGKQRPEDPPEVEGGSSIVAPIGPGKTVTFTVDLKQLYNITQPGLYTLDVTRTEENNKTVVRSNTLTLNIAP
jgi:hypothetical protein